jgi:hypothetical protein
MDKWIWIPIPLVWWCEAHFQNTMGDFNFWQNLQNLLKLRHRRLRYWLFFTKLSLRPPSHLHHHVGELHPINVDWTGLLHNVNWLSKFSTSSKTDFPSHLQGLMTIQMVDLVMIKTCCSNVFMRSYAFPIQGYLLSNALNDIKTNSTMCTKLAQVSQNSSFFTLIQITLALVSDF